MGYLHDYEYSRESAWIREQVDFIRYGRIEAPTYWSPNPAFGWPEWPNKSYLSIPANERQKRLPKLLATNDEGKARVRDDLLALSVRPPIQGEPTRGKIIPVWLDPELTPEELERAIMARVRIEPGGKPREPARSAEGRAAAVLRRKDRMRSLCAARARQLYSPGIALEKFNGSHREKLFSDARAMRHSADRAHRHLVEFELRARRQLNFGLWMPPFGGTLVPIEKRG